MLNINHDRCTRCKICIGNCPFGALSIVDGFLEVSSACTLCGACVNVCPFEALHIERKQIDAEELRKYKGVFVWAELENGKPRKVVLELLGKGRELADQLGQELSAVIIAAETNFDPADLGNYGADRVILCQHKFLDTYSTEGYTQALSAVIASEMPSVVLYGATPHGRDLAPRVAARLRLGLTADCTRLSIDDDGQLVQTRPAFGGNIMASIITPHTRPQTATVRPNVFPALEPDPSRLAEVVEFPLTMSRAAIRTRLVQSENLDADGQVGIADARIIVSGGRGMGKAANLEMLKTLADQLGGTTAGSRIIVEQGWIPHTHQVGQSGTTVGPQLYIAAGISGAVQHLVGMSASKTVIAINKDPEAPILNVADLGIVGDALEIIPILNQMIEDDRNKNS